MTRYQWRCALCPAWGWVGEQLDGEPSPEQTAAAHDTGLRVVLAHRRRKHREAA